MSSSSSSTQNQARTARMATRQRLQNQESQKGRICFVLNEYRDDPDTYAYVDRVYLCRRIRPNRYPLAKARSVPANMLEFLSWAQKHHRIDVTATVERKAGGPASTETCPGGCKQFSHKGSNAHSIGLTCTATRLSYMFSSTHGPRREQHMYEKDLLHRLWNLHRFCSARDLQCDRGNSFNLSKSSQRVGRSCIKRYDHYEATNRSSDKNDDGTSLTFAR